VIPSSPIPSRGKYDVVVFSIIDWEFRYQRPQQITSQFAAHGHRVFYVSLTRFLPRHDPGKYALRMIKENLYEVCLSVHPPPELNRSEIQGDALDGLMDALADLRREQHIQEAVSYVMLSSWAKAAIAARNRWGWRLLYDCMDDWAHFPDFPPALISAEPELVHSSDLVVVPAQALVEKWRRYGTPILVVRNAVDADFYRAHLQPNNRLSHLPHPIIGFFGGIASWLDFQLIGTLAARRPEYTFVFLGDLFVDTLSLDSCPNVHFLGKQPYETMPEYLFDFDVCLIPFKTNSLTAAVDPVKIYEYFASGKPVVSVKMPEVERFEEAVYIANDQEDCLKKIDTALAENDTYREQLRRALAAHHTWSRRYGQIHHALVSITPRASIIIVTHNNLSFTRDCLDSLFTYTEYPNYEVIVVDNASTDDTRDYLRNVSRARSNLILIFNEVNVGFAQANNLGLRRATGNYLVLLNNDTILPLGWLSRLLRHLQDPECGLVGPVTNFVGNEAKIDVQYNDPRYFQDFVTNDTWLHDGEAADISMLAMYCVAMRRDVYDSVGPLDEQFRIGMFEDDDYSHRVKDHGYRVICARDVFIHHHGQATFRKLIEDGSYSALVDENRTRYETKWNTRWIAHRHAELAFTPHDIPAELLPFGGGASPATPNGSPKTSTNQDAPCTKRRLMACILEHLPRREYAYLQDHQLSILEWCCAFGDGCDELQKAFPQSTVTGSDLSVEAVHQARKRYPLCQFSHTEFICREFDVIVVSNCLEYNDHHLDVLETHLTSCSKLYIVAVPHREPLIAGHASCVDLKTFPEKLGCWRRIHAESVHEETIADTNQLLIIYASALYRSEQEILNGAVP
jgi:GT2 family glycosyltransferase